MFSRISIYIILPNQTLSLDFMFFSERFVHVFLLNQSKRIVFVIGFASWAFYTLGLIPRNECMKALPGCIHRWVCIICGAHFILFQSGSGAATNYPPRDSFLFWLHQFFILYSEWWNLLRLLARGVGRKVIRLTSTETINVIGGESHEKADSKGNKQAAKIEREKAIKQDAGSKFPGDRILQRFDLRGQ